MSESWVKVRTAAIRLVLDKLVAIEGAPVEFASDFYRRQYGRASIRPLTSEEVVAARLGLERLATLCEIAEVVADAASRRHAIPTDLMDELRRVVG